MEDWTTDCCFMLTAMDAGSIK